jgi:hypothetical protein
MSLLEECLERDKVLRVPHSGDHRDRFTSAMRDHNDRFEREGQAEWDHYCEGCMRFWVDDNEVVRKLRVAVTDGVSVGRHSCNVLHCSERLENIKDRFCTGHHYVEGFCAILDCSRPVIPGRQSCDDPAHCATEDAHHARNKALFQLKNYKRSKIAPPHSQEDGVFPASQEPLEHPDNCPSKPDTGVRRPRAIFGRRQTHNEQLIVYPCGIIAAIFTFYGSETVPQLVVSLFEPWLVVLPPNRIWTGYVGKGLPLSWVYARHCDI